MLWPKASDGDDASWQARVDVWNDPGAMVGGSDAGAHLDRMCGSNYPTSFLGDCLRKRKLVPMERAIQLMTEAPAELFGLHDRGRVAEGLCADLFVFDPETVGSEPATLVHDLPGGSPRLIADAIGVVRVLVNGVETIADGKPTGNLPGTLLRSGRDTVTVDPSAAGPDGRPAATAGRRPAAPALPARLPPRRRHTAPASDLPPHRRHTLLTRRRSGPAPADRTGDATMRTAKGDPPWVVRPPGTRRSS